MWSLGLRASSYFEMESKALIKIIHGSPMALALGVVGTKGPRRAGGRQELFLAHCWWRVMYGIQEQKNGPYT